MEQLEAVLPGIEDFLRRGLAVEELSPTAETTRQQLLRTLDEQAIKRRGDSSVAERKNSDKKNDSIWYDKDDKKIDDVITMSTKNPADYESPYEVAEPHGGASIALISDGDTMPAVVLLTDEVSYDHRLRDTAFVIPRELTVNVEHEGPAKQYPRPAMSLPAADVSEGAAQQEEIYIYGVASVPDRPDSECGPPPLCYPPPVPSNGHYGGLYMDVLTPDERAPSSPEAEENIYEDVRTDIQSGTDITSVEDAIYEQPIETLKPSVRSGGSSSSSDFESTVKDTDEDARRRDDVSDNESPDVQLPTKQDKSLLVKEKHSKRLSAKRMLADAQLFGQIYYKGQSNSWSKRFSVLYADTLYCYKKEKDEKPTACLKLTGYEAVVLLINDVPGDQMKPCIRLSHPGKPTHFFSADDIVVQSRWLELISAATTLQVPVTEQQVPQNASQESPSHAAVKQLASKLGFGKKKKSVRTSTIEIGGNFIIAGYLYVATEATMTAKWSYNWVIIRDNFIQCYAKKDAEVGEFVLELNGLEIEAAANETKKPLAVKLLYKGKVKMALYSDDRFDMGS
ncbi:PREDICTED: uncharacterized protein LOC106807384, partial [Priapulus caudatus]|uniref:Uncharacterized protein LOC106807384 n=1 Tax=Priapulus caudatus TaxID=37621 RepID=A0ABM1DZ18_PRICU